VAQFPEDPELVLELSAPITDLQLAIRSHESPSLLIRGPVTADHRNLPERCSDPSTRFAPQRLEPGVYGIFIGGGAKPPAFMNLVLASSGHKADPLLLAPKLPATLPLLDRDADLHFVELDWEALLTSDDVRFGLYARAPRALFVYPVRDLDEKTAKFIRWETEQMNEQVWPVGEAPAREFPRKDEPVLFFGNGRVLTADGLVFDVDMRDLVAAPAGAPVLPAAPRNPEAGWPQSDSQHGDKGAKLAKDYDAAVEAWQSCHDLVWAPAGRQIEAIKAGPYHPGEEGRISAIQDRTARKVDAVCKTDALDKKKLETWKKLIEVRTQRRADALAAARKAL
jgi:hypothetical protein